MEKTLAKNDWQAWRAESDNLTATLRAGGRKRWTDVAPADVELLACHVHNAAMAGEIADSIMYVEQLLTRNNSIRQLHSIRYLLDSTSPIETYSSKVSRMATKHDVFISHASEDKEALVRPLAKALQVIGFDVWYDEFQLKVGDSLRRSIDRGLANSRYGIVVLSPGFLAKNWTEYELDGLVAKEIAGGKVILPLWHNVTRDDVLKYSPPLADKVALNTSDLSIDELAEALKDALDSA